ncbi:hypothetical protein BC628DRAFT_1335136 [Trametes gibbosa]|nr:hypothetical protein BC628DRAFT_1335136 [Trametes gibbosa]
MQFPESIRSPCPTTKSSPRRIRGLYFRSHNDIPLPVGITTTIPDVETALAKRFPCFESILGTRAFIHECLITCLDPAGKKHQFLLAYQEDPNLPLNRALQKVFPQALFRGEIVIMRGGTRSLVVNLKGKKEQVLAEEAVRRFLCEVATRRAHNRRYQRVAELPTVL